MLSLVRSSLNIAFPSLLLNKARSFLTVLGIVIGVAAVIILVAVGSGLREVVAGQFADLGSNLFMVAPGRVHKSGGGTDFSSLAVLTNSGRFEERDLRTLRSLEGVRAVAADLDEFIAVRYQGKSQTAIVGGANEDFLEIFNWRVAAGRFFTRSELEVGQKVVVLGDKVHRELFPVGAPLGEALKIGHERFRVVGVLAKKGGFGQFDWDNTVYMPLAAAKRFFGRERLDFLYFKADEDAPAPEMVRRAEAALRRRYEHDEFSVLEQGDLFKAADSIIGAITVALGGIAAISLLVGGIGIMNIMLVTVTERTKEIGLRRAVGARPRDILAQFLTEAVVLSSLGGVLGIILGYGGSLLLGRVLATEMTLWSVLLSFSVSAAVGVVFGSIPAYKASQLDPLTALRYE